MNDTAVARGTGVALWRQIQQSIQKDISDEVFRPGDRLPTEFELAATFGVNRHTVRRALAELEEKGLLRVEQGRGTFVREQIIEYPLGSPGRFFDDPGPEARISRSVLIGASTVPAEREVADLLHVPPRMPVLRMETAGEVEGRRITFACHHLPLPRFDGLTERFERSGSLTAAFRDLGIDDYTRRHVRIMARMPSGREAEHLDQPRTRPVLVTEAVHVDRAGVPIEFVTACFNSDWVRLTFDT